MLLLMLALALSSVLNALYFLRTVIRIFRDDGSRKICPIGGRWDYLMSMLVLIVINLLLGLASGVFVGWIETGLSMFA